VGSDAGRVGWPENAVGFVLARHRRRVRRGKALGIEAKQRVPATVLFGILTQARFKPAEHPSPISARRRGWQRINGPYDVNVVRDIDFRANQRKSGARGSCYAHHRSRIDSGCHHNARMSGDGRDDCSEAARGNQVVYRRDLAASARRHLRAGQVLYSAQLAGDQPGCRAIAGYLFGLSAELAIKQMMRLSGMKELPTAERRRDPFFAHFPELKTQLAKTLHGRRAGELRRLAEDPRLFQHWDTDMRYAPADDIQSEWIALWKASAENLIQVMSLN
jgi:hypothetical protein